MTMNSIAPGASVASQPPTRQQMQEQQRARERTFKELGGLAGYLEAVEMLACTGEFVDFEQAQAARAWALQHQANLDADAQRAAKQKAEADRVNAAWSRMQAAWQAHKLENPDARESEPGSFFDGAGENLGTLDGLTDLAEQVDRGELLRRDGADEDTRMCRWWRKQGETVPVHLQDTYVSEPRHWVLAVDTERVVPPGLSGGRLAAWAADWRDSIAGLEGTELVVYAVPGKHPAFVTWWPEALSDSQASAWCTRLRPPAGDADRRFEPIRSKSSIYGFSFPWRVPCEPVHLRSANAKPAALPTASGSRSAASAPTRLLTGIGAFDRLFRGRPGVPVGARLLVPGNQKNCKTMLASEAAHAAVEAGFFVGWFAKDENPDDITRRRLQRLGLASAEVDEPPAAALARLDAQAFRVTNEGTLEDLWELAHAEARGAPLLIVADSLQTVPTAAAMGKGEREGLEATIAAIEECQRRWPAIFIATAEITAGGTPKGSRSILYRFTTCVAVRRSGSRVTVTVSDSRHSGDGAFELVADFEGQRLLEPEAAALAAADAELWARMRVVLTELGGASQNELERRLGGKAVTVRACVKRHLAIGDLKLVGKKLMLA